MVCSVGEWLRLDIFRSSNEFVGKHGHSVHKNSGKWCGNLGFESGSFVLMIASALCLASALFMFCLWAQRGKPEDRGRTEREREETEKERRQRKRGEKERRKREKRKRMEQVGEEGEGKGEGEGEGGSNASKGCMRHRHIAI
jgi:hypothetical protein